jgi:HAD superfamily hydrolase (TIGR01450 family)
MGVRLALVTNNCSKTREEYLQFMEEMGLQGFTVDDVFSAGFATAQYLRAERINRIFLSGFPSLAMELRLGGIEVRTLETDPQPAPVDAVVVAKSDDFTYAEISRGMHLVRKLGARLIATNPDPNFPLSHGVMIPGSGAVGHTFQTACDVSATWIGKPWDPMFNTVIQLLGVSVNDIMMVGDRMMTDIAFASNHGARSVFVLSGVDGRDKVDAADPKDRPTYVLPSLVEVVDLIRSLNQT